MQQVADAVICRSLPSPQKCKVPQRAANLKLAESSRSRRKSRSNADRRQQTLSGQRGGAKNMGKTACSRLERVIATSVSTFPKGKSNTCPAFFSKVFFNNKNVLLFANTSLALFEDNAAMKFISLILSSTIFQHSIYSFSIID